MSRPKKGQAIELDIIERMFPAPESDILIERVKDYATIGKIIELDKKDKISFAQLKDTKCFHRNNHWLDYWVQSGMLSKVFAIKIPDKMKKDISYVYNIDGLLNKPKYALVYLCVILQGVFYDQDFAQYINQLFIDRSKITDCDRVKAKKNFNKKQSEYLLDDYWILISKAADAWERGIEKIGYSESEISNFKDLLFHYWEDCFQYKSFGSWGSRKRVKDGQPHEVKYENEQAGDEEDDNGVMKLFNELGLSPVIFEELQEENISEEHKIEKKVTFERFSEIISNLFTKENEQCMEIEKRKTKDSSGYLGVRSVLFAPYLGPFFVGLNKYCKKFPFNPLVSLLDEVSDKEKKVYCPKECLAIMTFLKERGDGNLHCPKACMAAMGSLEIIENAKKDAKSQIHIKNDLPLFWKNYFEFCTDFFYVIIKKDQKYYLRDSIAKNEYSCITQKESKNKVKDIEYKEYKECITYIFERVFAYCLFMIEAKSIFVELINRAIKMAEEGEKRKGNKKKKRRKKYKQLCVMEHAEWIWERVQVVGRYTGVLNELYEYPSIHVRAKLAPKVINSLMDKSMCSVSRIDIDQMKILDLEHKIFGIEIDKAYLDFENTVLFIKKNAKDKSEVELKRNRKTEVWKDILKEMHDVVNEINDKYGNEIFEKDKKKAVSLFDKIFSWVVYESLNLIKF